MNGNRKAISGMMLILLVGTLTLAAKTRQKKGVTATGNTWIVGPSPSNFTKIQDAIDDAGVDDGDIIEIKANGTFPYIENVYVHKSLTIRRWKNDTISPVIDGDGSGDVFYVTAPNVVLSQLKIQNGRYGVHIHRTSADNFINDTEITLNDYGVCMVESNNNTFRNSEITGNNNAFRIEGNAINHFIHNINTSNTVNGKPIYYLVNQQNKAIPANAGYVAIVNSANVTVEGLVLKNNYQGLLVVNSTNVIVKDSNVTLNDYGIWALQMVNSTIIDNEMSDNRHAAVYLWNSSNNMLYHNNFINNTKHVRLNLSPDNNWDNGYEGNRWDNYKGSDADCDGIGDTSHVIGVNNTDNCPLMEPWSAWKTFKRAMEKEGNTDHMMKLYTYSNSTLACFNFSRFDKEPIPPHNWFVYKGQISLRATCGYNGFLNITIPRNWLDGNFTVLIDEKEANYILTANLSHSSIYITFEQGSHVIKIIGAEAGNIIGDLNGDGKVDISDVVIVTANYRAVE